LLHYHYNDGKMRLKVALNNVIIQLFVK